MFGGEGAIVQNDEYELRKQNVSTRKQSSLFLLMCRLTNVISFQFNCVDLLRSTVLHLSVTSSICFCKRPGSRDIRLPFPLVGVLLRFICLLLFKWPLPRCITRSCNLVCYSVVALKTGCFCFVFVCNVLVIVQTLRVKLTLHAIENNIYFKLFMLNWLRYRLEL